MKTSASDLKRILKTNVAEIKFIRRIPKSGASDSRRMLCTNCTTFLNSYAAKSVFNFNPPTSSPRYSDVSKNLVTTFDLFMQQFRNINASTAEIITVIPVASQAQQEAFWNYFNGNVINMNSQQKVSFMNK